MRSGNYSQAYKIRFRLIILIVFIGVVKISFSKSLFNLIDIEAIRIAVFDVDATPPVGSQLTYDPMLNSDDLSLRAKGLILLGSNEPIVLCSIDWIGISNESQDVFKEALAEAAGTIPNRVVVHTVHQHDAPICDFTAEKILIENNISPGCFDGTFARKLIADIQQSIRTSLEDTKEVTDIGMGVADVFQVASNRRVHKKDGRIVAMRGSSSKDSLLRAMPEGLIDSEVSLLSFWQNDTPLAVLSFYATHPQSYYLTKIANPDFPGIARYLRQLSVPDALHIHFNGAGGNVAAGKYNDGSHENRYKLALKLTEGMERAWENSKKYSVNADDLGWYTENLFLPYNDQVQEIEKAMLQADSRFLANNMGRLGWYKRRMEGKGIETACLRVNDARILFMPGELFVEYQLAAKKMAPDDFVAMAAYGDYGPFYIGNEEAYAEGGYEILSSPVTSESEKVIVENMQNLLTRSNNFNCGNLLSYNKKGICAPIETNKEWDKKRDLILKNMQQVMGQLPKKHINRIQAQYTDSAVFENYVRYSIQFEVAPNEKVFAYLYRPSNVINSQPAVLALHGTGIEGKQIIDDNTNKRNRGYAKELAERGYVVIAPDYISMGEAMDYDFSNDRYDSGTMKGIFNHMSCIDLLYTLAYVDKNRIGVIGHSLGGHNAIFVAAFDPRIKAVVTSCGWTLFDYYNAGENVSKLYGGRLGPWAQERYMPFIKEKYNLDPNKVPFDFDEVIAAIAPRAFFSNSPLHDTNFSVVGVRKGVSQIKQVYHFLNAANKVQVVYPNSGHDFPVDIRESAYDFLDKHL